MTRSSISSALLLVSALAFGCSDDDGDGEGGGGGVLDASLDSGGGDGGAPPSAGPVVKADGTMDLYIVVSAPSGDIAAPNYAVAALDNDTGAALNVTGTSAANGRLKLSGLPAGKKVSIRVTGQPPTTIDTISYNYPVEIGGGEELIRVVPTASSQAVPSLAGFTPEADKGPTSGAVYYWQPNGQKGLVGCATVTIDNEGGTPIRYFGAMNLPQAGNTNTSPINGRFFVGNTKPGKQTVRAFDSTGREIGSVTYFAQPRSSGAGGDISLLAGIYLPQGVPNPTPAGCTQGTGAP